MPKSPQEEEVTILQLRIVELEDELKASAERSGRALADMESKLNQALQRADFAEATAKDLQDRIDGTDPEAALVEVHNGGEVRHIHPATVAAHKAAGWTRV